MSNSLVHLEEVFMRLSSSEQRWLIERLIRHVNETNTRHATEVHEQLALMAADPEIQNELKRIEQEFSYAESDGLETASNITG